MDPSNLEDSETKAIVCYDYTARNSEELTLSAGDVIRNVVKFDDEWWRGDLGNEKNKIFPANFVKEMSDDNIDDVS